MAIKNSHLVDLLAQKNLVKGFFDDLMYGTYDSEDSLRQRANFLGCDLSKQHAIALLELSRNETTEDEEGLLTEEDRMNAHKRIGGQVRRRIQDAYPGTIIYENENLLT